MEKEKIDRINALYRKSKAEGLTDRAPEGHLNQAGMCGGRAGEADDDLPEDVCGV